MAAKLYKPNVGEWPKGVKKPMVSLVTPVYNEDPEVFEAAMQSWITNGVNEIVAVIDKSNTRHIVDFERRYARRKDVKCRMMVTPKPGKRAALCDGIMRAKGDIIVLVDSDTIWDDNVLRKALPYFQDPNIGGATVGQRIQNPDTVGNVMFDILLFTRYREEVPFMLGVGKVFNTLSGRTAFYRRAALLNRQHDNIHSLRHEHFFGTRGVSGDDKRLTHLILEQGWHVAFVLGAEVYTPGLGGLKKFLKQRLRWTRNSWRADLRAMKRGWVWKHPALAVYMLDRFVQPIFMLIGPVACALAIAAGDWLAVGILIAWWLVSRFIRLFGYFRLYPKRLIYLPAYIIYGYVNALIKIYAVATLIENSWATRWHTSRVKRKKAFRKYFTLASGATAVLLFFMALTVFVQTIHTQSGASIEVPAAVETADFDGQIDFASSALETPNLPPKAVLPTGVKSYVIQPGDNLTLLSEKFGMSVNEIKKVNGLTSTNKIPVGATLLYYDRNPGATAQ